MKTYADLYEQSLEDEARKGAAHRLAAGRGIVPVERRNEAAEERLSDEMTRRAMAGEHFPASGASRTA